MSSFLDALRAPTRQSINNNALVPDASRTAPDQTEFLRLLTAQLAHQDPLNPQDSQAFVEQLATFTSLEQLGNIKNGIDELARAQSSVVSATAVDFAGRMATVTTDEFTLDAGEPAKLGAYLPESGALRATIKDENGNVVEVIELGAKEAGIVPFEWSGVTEDGVHPAGKYKLEVELVDGEETKPMTALVRSRVESVTFDKGYAELRILGRRFGLGEILEIG